jgi:hypothetical protein
MERYFICSKCGEVNSSEKWDKATSEVFDGDCDSILKCYKGAVWVCPSCKKESEIGFAEVTDLMNK